MGLREVGFVPNPLASVERDEVAFLAIFEQSEPAKKKEGPESATPFEPSPADHKRTHPNPAPGIFEFATAVRRNSERATALFEQVSISRGDKYQYLYRQREFMHEACLDHNRKALRRTGGS